METFSEWDNVEHFEQLVAQFAGSKYAVATDSCTNALFLCLQYRKQVHDEKYYYWKSAKVINIPKRTYISVPTTIIHCGYKIHFIDKHWTGAYDLYPLPIIDSANRFTENMYVKDTLQCLSFHSKKILSIGRGGMILTDSKEAATWLKKARHDGRPSIYYNDINSDNVDVLGWHMYMTPEQAVRGIEQFYNVNNCNGDCGCSEDFKVDLSQLNIFKPHEDISYCPAC